MGWILWLLSCHGSDPPIVEPVARYGVPTAALLKTQRAGELPEAALARLGESRWGPRWPDAPRGTPQPVRRSRGDDRDRDRSRVQGDSARDNSARSRDRGWVGSDRAQGPGRSPLPRVVALRGGRWATRSDTWWTLWDPALGAVAEAEVVGRPTPDGAWIVGRDAHVRFDPSPLGSTQHEGALWWGDDFAIQLELLPGPTDPATPFRAELSRGRAGGWFERAQPPGISVIHEDAEAILLAGCRSPEALWCALDRRCACQTSDGLVAFASDGTPLGTWSSEDQGLQPSTVLFIPGRNTLVLGGRQGEVALWTPHTEEARVLDLARDFGTPDLAVSSDGSLLLATRSDGAIALIDTRDGERIDPEQGARPSVVAVAVDPQGRIAALDAWGSVRMWDTGLKQAGPLRPAGTDKTDLVLRSGGGVCAVGPSSSACWTVAGQPDDVPASKRWGLAGGRGDPPVRLIPPGGPPLPLPELRSSGSPRSSASSDDHWVLVQGDNRVLVDVEHREVHPLPGPAQAPAAVDDQGRVWIAAHPRLEVTDATGLLLGHVPLQRRVTSIAIGAQIVVVGHPDGTLTVFDVDEIGLDSPIHHPARPAPAPPGPPGTLDLRVSTPHSKRLKKGAQLRRDGDTLIRILEGERLPLEGLPADGPSAVSVDGAQVAAASGDRVWLWRPDGPPQQLRPGLVHQLAMASSGRWLAVLGEGGVTLINPDQGEVLWFLSTGAPVPPDAILRFSEDGTELQLEGGWIWSVPDGIATQHPLRGKITTLAASDDGAWIAAATDRGDVVIVDRASGEAKLRREGLGPVAALSFVGQDGQLWLGDIHGGTARITGAEPPLRRHGSWPWRAVEGLRIEPGGRVGIYDGARWWVLDVHDPHPLHTEPAAIRPSWLEATGTQEPLWFSGPGVDAPVPPPDAPCELVASVRCDPQTAAAPPNAADLSGLRPSPRGTAISGVAGERPTLRSADHDITLDPIPGGGRYTWMAPDRLLGVSEHQLLAWEGSEPAVAYPLSVRGATHRIAAASGRVLRWLDGFVLAQTLEGQPECVLPTSDPPGPMALSTDGVLAVWGTTPTVADLDACEILFPKDDDEPLIPAGAQAVLYQGVGRRFGEELHTGAHPGWIHRQDPQGHRISWAQGASGALSALDPTGTYALIQDQLWSIEPLRLLRTLPEAPAGAAVSPDGRVAWLAAGALHLEHQGELLEIPPDEAWGDLEAVAFAPSGELLIATSNHQIHLVTAEAMIARVGPDPPR